DAATGAGNSHPAGASPLSSGGAGTYGVNPGTSLPPTGKSPPADGGLNGGAGPTASSSQITDVLDSHNQSVLNRPTNDRNLPVAGTAAPGAAVALYVDGQHKGTVVASPLGTWKSPIGPALADGPHTISAGPGAHGVPPTSSVTINVDTAAPVIQLSM